MSAPERWLAISVRSGTADGRVAELLPEALRRLGGAGAEEDADGAFTTYIPDPGAEEGGAAPRRTLAGLLEEARRELVAYTGAQDLHLTWRWQEHEDWAETWRRGFEPRRITERLVVSPSWLDPELRPGELLITLDPGVAFGTAEHASTRGCLRLLDGAVEPGERWADVGSGSGILAIAAVRLGAQGVTAIEPDALSCTAAEENAKRNAVEDQVEVLRARATPEFLHTVGPFDGIVSNIESGVILPLLPSYRALLEPGGTLILSGILAAETEEVVEEARQGDFELMEEDEEDRWWSGLFRAGAR